MSVLTESEIKSLLEKHKDPELVADSLLENFQDQLQNSSSSGLKKNLTEICRFLLNAGLYKTLVAFCLKNINDEHFPFPWVQFIDGLNRGCENLDPDVVALIQAGIEEAGVAKKIAFAYNAELFFVEAPDVRRQSHKNREKELQSLRARLKDELLTLRAQQLFDQEKAHLLRLQKIFPTDAEILQDLKSFKERRALDVLSRRSPRAAHEKEYAQPETTKATEGLKESFQKTLENSPALAFDFAVAAFMIEDYETCLDILSQADLTLEQKWFELEVKIKSRRFLEVLHELTKIEIANSSDPEIFFAAAYLRAQAYWGLQQKHTAIEILETILETRPNYRSGAALLDTWRVS